MTTWHAMTMEADDATQNMIQRIMTAFTPKYIGSGQPIGMAIFSSYNEESNQVTLYFTPKAANLAMQFGAQACEANFVDQTLSLLVGDERSVAYLFPDAEER